jgi:glycosyltransferase involved in cell wall biosynthesis
MIRLLILIRRLEAGGAERQLIELIKALDRSQFAVTVVTYYEGGELAAEARALAGVNLVSLNKTGRWDSVGFFLRLCATVRSVRPHIVYGYMSIANELALLAGRWFGARVVWGLRASNMDFTHYDAPQLVMFRVGALLSPLADTIIVNSEAGRAYYARSAYRNRHMVVVHNGIDSQRFHPDRAAGERVRAAWGLGSHERVVGVVARLDPMKDHATFLRAAALVQRDRPGTRFVCVGGAGQPAYRDHLRSLAAELGLSSCLLWTGVRTDMCEVYNALDVLVMSSCWGEGFPNVVGEAMACGVPCVVTAVGDSAHIVGDTGVVVPPRDPEALARGIVALVNEEPGGARGKAAHDRIEQLFSTARLAEATAALLQQLVPA